MAFRFGRYDKDEGDFNCLMHNKTRKMRLYNDCSRVDLIWYESMLLDTVQ